MSTYSIDGLMRILQEFSQLKARTCRRELDDRFKDDEPLRLWIEAALKETKTEDSDRSAGTEVVGRPSLRGRYEAVSERVELGVWSEFDAIDLATGEPVCIRLLEPDRATALEIRQAVLQFAALRIQLHQSLPVAHATSISAESQVYLVLERARGTPVKAIAHAGGSRCRALASSSADLGEGIAALHSEHKAWIGCIEPQEIRADVSNENAVWQLWRLRIYEPSPGKSQAAPRGARPRLADLDLGSVPPEILCGDPVDERSSVYWLGAWIYRTATRQPMRDEKLLRQRVGAPLDKGLVNRELAESTGVPRGIPRPIERPLRDALAARRGERFATMAAFSAALRQSARGKGLSWTNMRSGSRRHPILHRTTIGACGVLLVLAIAVGTWAWVNHARELQRQRTELEAFEFASQFSDEDSALNSRLLYDLGLRPVNLRRMVFGEILSNDRLAWWREVALGPILQSVVGADPSARNLVVSDLIEMLGALEAHPTLDQRLATRSLVALGAHDLPVAKALLAAGERSTWQLSPCESAVELLILSTRLGPQELHSLQEMIAEATATADSQGPERTCLTDLAVVLSVEVSPALRLRAYSRLRAGRRNGRWSVEYLCADRLALFEEDMFAELGSSSPEELAGVMADHSFRGAEMQIRCAHALGTHPQASEEHLITSASLLLSGLRGEDGEEAEWAKQVLERLCQDESERPLLAELIERIREHTTVSTQLLIHAFDLPFTTTESGGSKGAELRVAHRQFAAASARQRFETLASQNRRPRQASQPVSDFFDHSQDVDRSLVSLCELLALVTSVGEESRDAVVRSILGQSRLGNGPMALSELAGLSLLLETNDDRWEWVVGRLADWVEGGAEGRFLSGVPERHVISILEWLPHQSRRQLVDELTLRLRQEQSWRKRYVFLCVLTAAGVEVQPETDDLLTELWQLCNNGTPPEPDDETGQARGVNSSVAVESAGKGNSLQEQILRRMKGGAPNVVIPPDSFRYGHLVERIAPHGTEAARTRIREEAADALVRFSGERSARNAIAGVLNAVRSDEYPVARDRLEQFVQRATDASAYTPFTFAGPELIELFGQEPDLLEQLKETSRRFYSQEDLLTAALGLSPDTIDAAVLEYPRAVAAALFLLERVPEEKKPLELIGALSARLSPSDRGRRPSTEADAYLELMRSFPQRGEYQLIRRFLVECEPGELQPLVEALRHPLMAYPSRDWILERLRHEIKAPPERDLWQIARELEAKNGVHWDNRSFWEVN